MPKKLGYDCPMGTLAFRVPRYWLEVIKAERMHDEMRLILQKHLIEPYLAGRKVMDEPVGARTIDGVWYDADGFDDDGWDIDLLDKYGLHQDEVWAIPMRVCEPLEHLSGEELKAASERNQCACAVEHAEMASSIGERRLRLLKTGWYGRREALRGLRTRKDAKP